MKTLLAGLGSLLLTGWLACAAHAEWCPPVYPCYVPSCGPQGCHYVRTAPDMCGPGFYSTNCCGAPYGPNYCVHPPFPPVGTLPPQLPNKVPPQFATHPFARGPRDFFMLDR